MNPIFPLALSVAVRRAGFRIRQRGFTLIELAIAMAVIGLVLGASLIPLRALEERRQLQDEQRRLETVRDAVVGYALRHRTRARTLKLATWYAPDSEFRLPAGRPYLPCPDWDGDGFEDRHGFPGGMDLKPVSVTATLGERNIADEGGRVLGRALFWASLDWAPGDLILASPPHGECKASRGAVPWRTLGVDPSDGWGNRHTYFADPVFSNAMFGFDRQTIADVFDPRIPEAAGLESAPRFANYIGREASWTNGCPAVICDGGAGAGGEAACARGWGGRWWPCGAFGATLALKAGAAARTEIDAPSGEKRFPAGSVTDGLPFVLVSHGPNGRFAVNHWATLTEPVDLGGEGPVCNLVGGPEISSPRLSNRVSLGDERGLAHEAANGSRSTHIGYSDNRCPPALVELENRSSRGFHLSLFAWEPPGVSRRGEFDDLLLWMTREELSLAVPGRIPPLPQMVIAYFP